MKNNKTDDILGCAVVLFLAAIISLLINWLAVTLWNWLVPTAFNGPELSFWQMYVMVVLINLLFGFLRKGRGKYE